MVLPNAGSILGYLMLGSLVFLGERARRGGLANSLAIAMARAWQRRRSRQH